MGRPPTVPVHELAHPDGHRIRITRRGETTLWAHKTTRHGRWSRSCEITNTVDAFVADLEASGYQRKDPA